MASYFARVELHGAAWPTAYEGLHAGLQKHGFTNCIEGRSGLMRLPTAFYFAANLIDDLDKVEDAVRACANATGYTNEVVVVRSGGWQGHLSKNC